MLFTLVLGLLIGAAAVVLIEQWLRGVLADRPARVITPSGASIFNAYRGRRAA